MILIILVYEQQKEFLIKKNVLIFLNINYYLFLNNYTINNRYIESSICDRFTFLYPPHQLFAAIASKSSKLTLSAVFANSCNNKYKLLMINAHSLYVLEKE